MLWNAQTKPDGVRGYSERFGEGVAKRHFNIIKIENFEFFSKIIKLDYFIIYYPSNTCLFAFRSFFTSPYILV